MEDLTPFVEASRVARRLGLPAREVEIALDRTEGVRDAVYSEGYFVRGEGENRENGGRWGGSIVRAVGECGCRPSTKNKWREDEKCEKEDEEKSLAPGTPSVCRCRMNLHCVRHPCSLVLRRRR